MKVVPVQYIKRTQEAKSFRVLLLWITTMYTFFDFFYIIKLTFLRKNPKKVDSFAN